MRGQEDGAAAPKVAPGSGPAGGRRLHQACCVLVFLGENMGPRGSRRVAPGGGGSGAGCSNEQLSPGAWARLGLPPEGGEVQTPALCSSHQARRKPQGWMRRPKGGSKPVSTEGRTAESGPPVTAGRDADAGGHTDEPGDTVPSQRSHPPKDRYRVNPVRQGTRSRRHPESASRRRGEGGCRQGRGRGS